MGAAELDMLSTKCSTAEDTEMTDSDVNSDLILTPTRTMKEREETIQGV